MFDKFRYAVLKYLQIVSLMLFHFERTHQKMPIIKKESSWSYYADKAQALSYIHQNLL